MMTGNLDGKVAVVAGATVYCTGRSTREQRSDIDRPEHIEGTAELVTARGGQGIVALAADPDVAAKASRTLSSWSLSDEYGYIDIDGRKPHWGRHAKAHGLPHTEE